LGAVFTLWIERDRPADVAYPGLDPAGARFRDAEEEVAFGIAGVFRHQGRGETVSRS
jgi:hypothetical protein